MGICVVSVCVTVCLCDCERVYVPVHECVSMNTCCVSVGACECVYVNVCELICEHRSV